MFSLLEHLTNRLVEVWRPKVQPLGPQSFSCQCGRSVYFRNSACLACGTQLGYDPQQLNLFALEPGNLPATWKIQGAKDSKTIYRRCENLETPAACNWLVPTDDSEGLCRSCRLNRYIPDLADADNQRYWRSLETAKRRLVAQLLMLHLPVVSKVSEDPEHGLMFDFLRSPKDGPRVLTGHANGLITLNVEEADDAIRERTRHEMREPYRTLLGHFRHEVGHYYWDRLIANSAWLEPFRSLFGDERTDYAAALRANYENGPPDNWRDRYISSYASVHPWEDWAESWAHYMHLTDSLNTALSFGLTAGDLEANIEPFAVTDLYAPRHPQAKQALTVVNSWVEMITVLNELARSLGQPDFYPFVLSKFALKKIHFIHLVIRNEAPPNSEG